MHFMPPPSPLQYCYLLAGALLTAAVFIRWPGLSLALAAALVAMVVSSFFVLNTLPHEDRALASPFMGVVEVFITAPYFAVGMVVGPLLGLLSAPLVRRARRSKA